MPNAPLDIARRLARLPIEQREAAMRTECNGDDALRREVERLLSIEDGATIQGGSTTETSDNGAHAPAAPGPSDHTTPKYRLLSALGEGGMGLVYLAEQTSTGQRVAMKFLRPGLVSSLSLKRFEREARTLGRLQHTGIARVLDAGSMPLAPGAPPQPFIAMEFVQGEAITDFVCERGMSFGERLSMIVELCRAVHHAHTRGVIHRDLKPSNTLVTNEGEVKVLDFGIARVLEDADAQSVTEAGSVLGTLAYMSPEQASGAALEADTRSDVFSLGLVMLETLTGRKPDLGHTPTFVEALRRASERDIATDRSQFEGLPRDLAIIVSTATAHDPDRRYQSAEELAADIERFTRNEPIAARAPSAWYIATRFAQRHKGAAIAAVLVVLTLAGGVVAASTQAVIATRERDRAITAERSSNAVNALLVNMLTSADPERSLGENLLVRDVLDEAERTLALDQSLADEPYITGVVRSALGRAYYGLGVYDKADANLKAAQDLLNPLGERGWKPSIDARRYTGMIALQRGDAEEALKTARSAHKELSERLGPDHIESIQARGEVAHAMFMTGKHDDAMALFLETAEQAERVLGPDNNTAITARHNYAAALRDMGEFAASAEQLRPIVERRTALLGADHPQTLFAKNNLAASLSRTGAAAESERLFREAYEGRTRTLGPDHPDTAATAMNLANVLLVSGQIDEAEPLVRSSLNGYSSRYGDVHPRTATAINLLAYLVEERGDLDEAEALYRRSVHAVESLSGTVSPEILAPMNNLAMLLVKNGKHAEADALFVTLIERASAIAGPNHPFVAVFKSNRATALTQLGEPQAAIALLEEALPVIEGSFGAEHARAVTARERLAVARAAAAAATSSPAP